MLYIYIYVFLELETSQRGVCVLACVSVHEYCVSCAMQRGASCEVVDLCTIAMHNRRTSWWHHPGNDYELNDDDDQGDDGSMRDAKSNLR